MELKGKHAVLAVDDETSILSSLQRVFRKAGLDLVTASSGAEGLEKLQAKEKDFPVIISDQRMPEMTGSQFLERAREAAPNAIRILLTGYTDMEALVEAINKGKIHQYLTKPWNEDELIFQVRQALRQYELVMENQHLLSLTREQNDRLIELNLNLERKVAERTQEIYAKNELLDRLNKELETSLYNTVRAFGSMVEMHSPMLSGHGRRVSLLSRQIAQVLKMSEKDLIQVEIAALLHDIGKLGLPQRILQHQVEVWSAEDKALYRQHSQQGQTTVQFIGKLDEVGVLIRAHHERYDGGGFPDHLAEGEIPLGARIVSVADAYDRIVELKNEEDPALRQMMREIRQTQTHLIEEEVWQKVAVAHFRQQSFLLYDPDVVKALLGYLTSQGVYRGEKRVAPEDLREGMVLSRPLYSERGQFLLPHRTELTPSLIHKLKSIQANEPFQNMIYVAIP